MNKAKTASVTKVVLKFPLCLLSLDLPVNEKMKCIISYGILHTEEPPETFLVSHDEDILVTEELDCDIESIQSSFQIANDYYTDYKNITGKEDAWVQINTKACLETMEGSLAFDLFAVICSVSSTVGQSNKYGWATISALRHRMSGYKTVYDLKRIKKTPLVNHITSEILSHLESPFLEYNRMKVTRLRDKAARKKFFIYYYNKSFDNDRTYYSTQIRELDLIIAEIKTDIEYKNQIERENRVIKETREQELFVASSKRRKKNLLYSRAINPSESF